MGIQLSSIKKLDIKEVCKNVKTPLDFYMGKQLFVMKILFLLIYGGSTVVSK